MGGGLFEGERQATAGVEGFPERLETRESRTRYAT
jgi:hypothetical protein